MKKFITAGLMKLIGMLMDSKVLEMVKVLVAAQFATDNTGAEKKAAVDAALRNLRGEAAALVAETSGCLLNLAIEAAVVYLKVRGGR